MNKEIVSVKPRLFSLEESNDIYMTLTMCVLTNQVNLNNALFTDDFIDGVIANKDKYVGIPLVASKSKLENGLYLSLSHEFDSKSGELKTDQIGSFVDFWDEIDSTDGSRLLMGSVRVLKRFPNVCNAMIDLYESGNLEFSCETFVYGYSDVQGNVRSISYEFDGQVNSLFASAVVSNPAEVKSRAIMLVAEALEIDLKGGEILSSTPKVEVFNKGNEVRLHGEFETASLKYTDVSAQIYNLLNPVDPKTNYREYEYWISDLYLDYVVVEDWDNCDELYRINYSIVNDVVVLDPESSWIQGTKGFIPNGVTVDDLVAKNLEVTLEMENKITEINDLTKEVTVKMEEKVKELEATVVTLSSKITKLESTIVSQVEAIQVSETEKATLTAEVAALKPFKEKVETAENDVKKETITNKFSKILSEEVMKTEQVISAIESLDEATLNSIVVAEVGKEIAAKTTSQKPDNVIVTASHQSDLLPQNAKDRMYAERS